MHVVTGGTYGIGRACVEHLARHGKRVVATGRDQAAGEELAAALPAVTFLPGDVSNPEHVQHVVGAALELGDGKLRGWSTTPACRDASPSSKRRPPTGTRFWT